MKICLLFILPLIVFISCAEKTDRKETPLSANDNLYVVDIDHAETQDLLLYSSLYCRVRPVVLEASDSVLIGNIDKIQADDNGIFILDRNQAKGVFMFSAEGRFIRRIGNFGNGPGEYVAPYDFTLNSKNNVIYVLDNVKQRVNQYDIITGKFLAYTSINQKNGILSYHIQYDGGALFADTYFSKASQDNYLLQKIDTATGKQLSAYLNNAYNKGWENLNDVDDKVFYQVDGESSRFVQRFMDTIVYVSATEVKPYLVLKSGKTMSEKTLKAIDRNRLAHLIYTDLFSTGQIFGISNYVEKDDLIYFRYIQGSKGKTVFYNTRTNKATFYEKIKDDLLFAEDASSVDRPDFGCATERGVYYYSNGGPAARFKLYARNGVLAPCLSGLVELKNMSDNAPIVFFYEYKN